MLHLSSKPGLLVAACVLVLSQPVIADETETAYVDSVYGWGSWELGLQPAAGGQAPSPQRAVTAIRPDTSFRPNDNSAFTPSSRPVTQTTIRPAPLPAPVQTFTPSTGTATPGNAPTGNPADRWL